jgi:hypothetical protein
MLRGASLRLAQFVQRGFDAPFKPIHACSDEARDSALHELQQMPSPGVSFRPITRDDLAIIHEWPARAARDERDSESDGRSTFAYPP